MTALCEKGRGFAGGSRKHTCIARAVPGSMFCAAHRDEALARSAQVVVGREKPYLRQSWKVKG